MTPRPALPGRIVFRLAPGIPVGEVAAHRDVRLGRAGAASAIDGDGPLDRTVLHRTDRMRLTRAFVARRSVDRPGRRHLDWDPIEEEVGMSRTFRLEVDPASDAHAIAADLRDRAQVEMASPQYLAETPFDAAPAPADAADAAEAPEREDAARRSVGAAAALRLEPGDTALIVALVDSGVELDHDEVRGRLRPGLNAVSAAELAEGVALVTRARARGQDVDDDQGHGTCCAGILVGNGFRLPRGLAGAARLLPIRVLCAARVPGSDHPTAVGSLPDIDSGLKTAVDLGARILNLSFGTVETALGEGDPVPHAEVVRYALAHDCVLVAASGNGGDARRYYPAALPGVVAVGSVDDALRPSRFTSRGPHVALSAPGERLACAGLHGYTRASGTSFAAPLVAAAAALVLARAARHSTALPPARVRDVLVESAAPFAKGAGAAGCGAGVLDVPAALRAVDAACQEDT